MRAGPWPTDNIQPPISPPRITPEPASEGSDRAVSTCPGTGARNVAAVKMRHRQCHDFTNWPVKTGPAAHAGPAARSAAAQRRAGICRTAPGAASLTATMMASPAKASAERVFPVWEAGIGSGRARPILTQTAHLPRCPVAAPCQKWPCVSRIGDQLHCPSWIYPVTVARPGIGTFATSGRWAACRSSRSPPTRWN